MPNNFSPPVSSLQVKNRNRFYAVFSELPLNKIRVVKDKMSNKG
jgi:hypothetical protein